ncbi:hypothetical protein RB595_006492 [Gaeumannomyces hyphopodioides]
MDHPSYSSNVVNTTTTSSYPSPSSTSSHSLQNHAPAPPQTLPPLQPQGHMMQQTSAPYGSYPHTPRTPATPNTPGSNGAMSNYPPPPAQQNVARAPYPGMMPNNQYQQPHQGYQTTQSMMPQSSTSMAHPQPIAPAPAPGGRAPPVLRPMPAGGVIPQPGMSSPYAQSPLMPQPQMMQQEGDQPTHVVGSQGRRGILPSAPGRPQAPVAGSVAAKNQIPQKDADGKFPCPHCNKTYLHAKHLKRHLLRHTGDRPYMCVLCRDTFSRSDILKRHFQKCSIRRGNPTGASHLSHPHAHVKKNQAAQKAMGNENELNPINGMGNMGPDGMVHPFGLIPSADGMGNMSNDQNHLSRQPSMQRMEDPNERDRRSASVMGQNGRPQDFNQGYNGGVPHSMAANINPQLANYPMQPTQNGMPFMSQQASNQQSGGLDWSQMFQAGAQNTYVNHQFPPNIGQTQIATIKPEPNAGLERPDGAPGGNHHPDPDDRCLFFDSWAPPSNDLSNLTRNPYQQISDQLINFFRLPDPSSNPNNARLHNFLEPDNIKSFLGRYTHFHRHFSILHIPTFRILDAYTGLLAGLCCVGACYSDRVSPDEVREVMNFLKFALERDSQLLASLDDGVDPEIKYGNNSFDSVKEIEELQAIMLMNILFIWNGTPEQRDSARRLFPLIAAVTRKAGLLDVSQGPSLSSALHQPSFSPTTLDPSSFDWSSWIEQEKRIRILFLTFLCDTALGLYFNSPPLFDPLQLQVPLPADDAAWDAPDSDTCAAALGLYGPDSAIERNPHGTRRPKQPETNLVLRALLHSSYQIQPGTTNLYGKFILIHSLMALMRRAQTEGLGAGAIMNGSITPLSHADWVVSGGGNGSWPPSANTSGRATPVDGTMRPEVLGIFATALDKFKQNWDADMASQFPPVSSQDDMNPQRQGFSRDGVHFYWLANYMLKNTKLGDLQMTPDHRFMKVMHLLKSVKDWVMSDGAKRGEELGSIGGINRDYGTQDLTLNMVDLFTPMPRVVESSGIASVKTELE